MAAIDRSSEAHSATPTLSSPTVGSVDGVRAMWELPTVPARAVLFVAHGCHCRPENFWWPSPRCPGCVSLPKDVAITACSLQRRFAVLVVASTGECGSLGKEVSAAKRVIQSWTAKNGLGGLLVAALGASSAVVIMIAEGTFKPSGDVPPHAEGPARAGSVAHVEKIFAESDPNEFYLPSQ